MLKVLHRSFVKRVVGMDYLVQQDIDSALEILGLTNEELAKELDISRVTINNWINNKTSIPEMYIQKFYDFVFKKEINLNKIKEQFYREDEIKKNEILLFHGAKTEIVGDLSLNHNKMINDFGNGFYCGESLEHSVMFVATFDNPSLYMLKFSPENLKYKKYGVDKEWMLTVAYYRGKLNNYKDLEIVKEIIKEKENIDYIIAPIANNRMFEIIDNFIEGEITDVQCQHCLSATNLGMQYVFVSEKALSSIKILEKCYLTEAEKQFYLEKRQKAFQINMDKVKLARKKYRNQGDYIEDILKCEK